MVITTLWIVAGWLCGWLLLLSLRRLKPAERVTVRLEGQLYAEGGFRGGQLPAMSVIIPARNEEGNLGPLLASLAKQTVRPLELIVVDDESTDDTAEIAARRGARVLSSKPLPSGWTGKSWACWQGAQAAAGEVLVFLDADIVMEADGLERLALAFQERGGLLSVQPYHWMKRPYERLSAFFNLIVLFAVGSSQQPSGAFGPCIVCSRAMYTETGGHRAVQGDVLENYHLGNLFLQHKLPLTNLLGRGVAAFRMYSGGLGALVRGWSKSFAAGAKATSPIRLLAISVWIAGAVSAVTQWFSLAAAPAEAIWLAALLYAAYAGQLVMLLRYAGNFGLTGLVFPVPLLIFLYGFALSAYDTYVRGTVSWKGRNLNAGKGGGKGQ